MRFAAGLVLLASSAAAHDLWLVPTDFRPRPGARIGIEARIGEIFPVSMNGPKKESLQHFRLVSAEGESDVRDLRYKAKVLAGRVIVPTGGTVAVVLEGTPRHIELEAPKFTSYLLHEGLAHMHEERRRRGEADQPGREDYSRHAKLLLRSGDGPGVATRSVGLTLEAVPSHDPYDLEPGQPLPLQVLFLGQPLAGIELRAYCADGRELRVRTGADGTASLPLDRPGVWGIAFIHMVRCEACPRADWRSFFGSLTFAR